MSTATPLPFPEFASRLLKLYQPPLKAPSTYQGMARVLRDFGALPGVETTYDLTTTKVAEFVHSTPGRNINTTISRLRCLKTASLFAFGEGWVERPPQWRRIMPRPAPPIRLRHYSHSDVCRLLAHLRADRSTWKARRLSVIASVVAYTGLRKQEALRLQREDVDLNARLLYVVARHRLKTISSAAPVPVPSELVPILEAWLPEAGPVWVFPGVRGIGPWRDGAPGYRPGDYIRRAAADAGLGDVTLHGLRHTLGKLLVGRFGATADQAKSVLRHDDVRTTEEHYLHRDDAEILRRIVRDVSFRPDPTAA